jgi:hypothetical protein
MRCNAKISSAWSLHEKIRKKSSTAYPWPDGTCILRQVQKVYETKRTWVGDKVLRRKKALCTTTNWWPKARFVVCDIRLMNLPTSQTTKYATAKFCRVCLNSLLIADRRLKSAKANSFIGVDYSISLVSAQFACTEAKHVVIQFSWYTFTGRIFEGNG